MREAKRSQQTLQATARGGACASPVAQRVEIAVRGHHAREQEVRPAGQAAFNAVDHLHPGLLGEMLERSHLRLELRRHLADRLGEGDPRHDRSRLSVRIASLRAHAIDYPLYAEMPGNHLGLGEPEPTSSSVS